jgi:MFS family permease
MVGWQLPQILTANHVARLGRVKRMVLMMTLHERWPFLAMALVIFMLPTLGPSPTLVLTFLLLTTQALGGGFTGTAWQSLIGKVIPQRQRGAFWGAQTAIANLTMAAAGYLSGRMLVDVEYPRNFAMCFLIAGVTMMASWAFVALTREPERENSRQKADMPRSRGRMSARFCAATPITACSCWRVSWRSSARWASRFTPCMACAASGWMRPPPGSCSAC